MKKEQDVQIKSDEKSFSGGEWQRLKKKLPMSCKVKAAAAGFIWRDWGRRELGKFSNFYQFFNLGKKDSNILFVQ